MAEGWVETFSMGGYGAYVWAAFGFTLLLMLGLLVQSWRAQRNRASELDELRTTLRGKSRPRQRLVATRPAPPGRPVPPGQPAVPGDQTSVPGALAGGAASAGRSPSGS